MTETSFDTHPDGVLRALADTERRRVLAFLGEHESVSERELADVLAGWVVTDSGVDVAGADEWERMAVALRHVHLPVLEDAGLVAVDDETVVLSDLPAWVDQCLAATFEADQSIDEQAVPADHRGDGD